MLSTPTVGAEGRGALGKVKVYVSLGSLKRNAAVGVDCVLELMYVVKRKERGMREDEEKEEEEEENSPVCDRKISPLVP